MGTCKNCKYFFNYTELESKNRIYKYGECKKIESSENEAPFNNSSLFSDEATVGINFGCIHFESNV